MTDISKFKSVAVDIDTYNKLELICKEERRNKRQQLGLMVDKECEKLNLNTCLTWLTFVKEKNELEQRQIKNARQKQIS